MKIFDKLPKSIKRTIRYIMQDVDCVDKLEEIRKLLNAFIDERKYQLQEQK